MRKDIRTKFKALFNCCHSNIARENSAVPVVRQENKKIPKINKKDSLLPLSPNTPVLYISPDGLCLRQLDSSSVLSDPFHPKFISYLCDVDYSIEEVMNNSQSSFNSELSKESEITLPTMSISETRLSEVPQKDIESLVLEKDSEAKEAKKVRFADSITIYHALTPTPEWIVSTKKTANVRKRLPSRIPTRIRRTDSIVPWKVELNSVNNPATEAKAFRKTVKASKISSAKRASIRFQSKLSSKIKFKTKDDQLTSNSH
ncbi:g_PROTEIN_RECEP_F1_2 domain-containing protein [Trichonephila clavata]|uniref:G_PROTEIN_RECEP_F1_2 domain-containing protein n=1 Tax=Trichonephila clavata TaxID=2740835 RepID=A0A8X6KNK7_TRICU|nr:g_PROTEIN_RECEP_F1_2 domain-containing protein [Trichonephila clavata]